MAQTATGLRSFAGPGIRRSSARSTSQSPMECVNCGRIGREPDAEEACRSARFAYCEFRADAPASAAPGRSIDRWRYTGITFWPLARWGKAQHDRNGNHSGHSRGRVRIHVPGRVCSRSRGSRAAGHLPLSGGSWSEGGRRGVFRTRLIKRSTLRLELIILLHARAASTAAPTLVPPSASENTSHKPRSCALFHEEHFGRGPLARLEEGTGARPAIVPGRLSCPPGAEVDDRVRGLAADSSGRAPPSCRRETGRVGRCRSRIFTSREQ
jgi:hypothetical protein